MFNFLKKSNERNNTNQNVTNSAEYERLSIRLSDVSAEIKTLKALFEALQTNVDSLRGNFNRRLKGLAAEEKQEPKEETEKFINGELVGIG